MTSQAVAVRTTGYASDPLAMIAASGKAASTVDKYTRALAPYIEQGGSLADVASLAEYAAGLSVSRRQHLRAAVALWADAAKTALQAQDTPATHAATAAAMNRLEALAKVITVPAATGQRAHTWLSEEQIAALEASCGADVTGLRDRVVLGLLVGCGLRRAELAQARWEDLITQPIEGQPRTFLNVRGKGNKVRSVPLTAGLIDLLADWSGWTGREGRIVRSLGRGLRIGDSLCAVSIYRVVARHGKAIGVPDLAAHDLRRTFAQRVWSATHDLLLVAELMGHASIVTTQRYLQLDTGKKRAGVAAISWGSGSAGLLE